MPQSNRVLIRGGGDLATGVTLRLYRAGIQCVITELARPLAVRRTVSFSEAVYEGEQTVEGVTAKRIEADQLSAWNEADRIPVIVDPDASILLKSDFPVVVDARLIKSTPSPLPRNVPLHIGLGPGFHAGENCQAVIETHRSHTLGRVYWTGKTQPDSGEPEGDPRRILRAPCDGIIHSHVRIGEHVAGGQKIATIGDHQTIVSPLSGVLRGMIRDELFVTEGLKVGDVDARDDPAACLLVSDKSLAIGGAVLEAILSIPEIRRSLYAG